MNPQERACSCEDGPDCKYLEPIIDYWCVNDACCEERGTKIPGIINCPYYEPYKIPWKLIIGFVAGILALGISSTLFLNFLIERLS